MRSQAREEQSTKARKRWESQIPGWLVLYSLALCGINAAKQHFSCKNFSGIVHEIVPAQPQEIPVYYGRKSGRWKSHVNDGFINEKSVQINDKREFRPIMVLSLIHI